MVTYTDEQMAELLDAYEQLATLYQIAHTISSPLQLEVVLDNIVKSTLELLGTDTAAILLLDDSAEYLTIKCARGLDAHVVYNTRDHLGESIAGRVVEQGQPIIANDLPQDPRFENPAVTNEELLACVSVPLRARGKFIGTLDVHSKKRRQAFNKTHVQLLEMLASQAAIAIENATLYERLSNAHSKLEARVQERTAALAAANERLRHEIAERARVEQELAEERNLLRTLLDLLPDRIYVKDTHSRFINANRTLIRIMGAADLEDLVGKTDFDFYPPELAEQYYADDQAVVQTGKPMINREEPNVEQDTGTPKWILTSKTPFHDHQGNIIGLVGIGRDITERKDAEKALQHRNRELAMLNYMSEALQTCHTEDETYKVMLDVCEQLFPQDAGALFILDSASPGTLKMAVSWGETFPNAQSIYCDQCISLRHGHLATTMPDELRSNCPYLQAFPGDCHLCVPVHVHNEVLGTLHLHFTPETIAYPDADWQPLLEAKQILVTRIAEQYALFLVNLRLRETLRMEAIRDPLTGLYNRRHMEAALKREAARVERHDSTLGIIMLDIDHFKQLNDRYGHEAGDMVLQELGRFLLNNVRNEDIACRYGGEEFLIIMIESSLQTTRKRAIELCSKIRRLRVDYHNPPISFTISAGVAALPEHGPGVTHVVKAADMALYQAKTEGRDQVVCFAGGNAHLRWKKLDQIESPHYMT